MSFVIFKLINVYFLSHKDMKISSDSRNVRDDPGLVFPFSLSYYIYFGSFEDEERERHFELVVVCLEGDYF